MKKTSILSLAVISLLTSQVLWGAEQNLFTMEKSYNPENIMVIHTNTDKDCKFINGKKDLIDFYWLMNGKERKPVHSMIRSGVEERVQVTQVSSQRDQFKVKLNDLSEVKHDLEDPSLEVISEYRDGECQVKSILTLGASHKYRKVDITRTYCEVTSNFLGIPNGCKYLDLEGEDIDSGEAISVRFKKK